MTEFALEPGEQVITHVRKHWFVFVIELLPFPILALAPLALPTLLTWVDMPIAIPLSFDNVVGRAFLGAWWLILWTGAFAIFTRYYLNSWILTNMRIVDIDQKRFFHRDVSSLVLNRVQDITVETKGLLFSLLNIGTISVQSAGATERFKMKGVSEPNRLRDVILTYVPNPDPSGL
jgi:hypothetical protein